MSTKKPSGGKQKSAPKTQYITNAPDWNVIKTYFTTTDIQHMLNESQGSIDLSSCASVLANAQAIYGMVSKGYMPPGNPWPAEKINNFYSWMNSNPTCS